MASAPRQAAKGATAEDADTDTPQAQGSQGTGSVQWAIRTRAAGPAGNSRVWVADVAESVVVGVVVVDWRSAASGDDGRAPHVPSRCRVPCYQSA